MHWRRATIAAVMAALHALVNSVAALFAAAATQIGRTKNTQKEAQAHFLFEKKF
jgi:hypothetical protein